MASTLATKELTDQVVGYRKNLAAAVTGKRTEEVTQILNRLKSIPATEELIRETKIGLSVGKLRQNENKAVADLAKEIVKKWKNEVGAKPKTEKGGTPAASPPAAPSPVPGPSTPGASASQSPAPTPVASASASASAPKPSKAVPTPTRKPSVSTLGPNQSQSSDRTKPRSAKEDGVVIPTTGDTTRDKCTQLVYDGLAIDSVNPAEDILERAQAIERVVREMFSGQEANYRNKMRSLYLNLKDKNNPSLRASVVSGEVTPQKLAAMTPKEMASEERKAQNQKLREDNLLKAQGAKPQAAETDMFKCGRCHQRKCTYYQMQTRSADEPMTTFVTCVNCNNRWKFS